MQVGLIGRVTQDGLLQENIDLHIVMQERPEGGEVGDADNAPNGETCGVAGVVLAEASQEKASPAKPITCMV